MGLPHSAVRFVASYQAAGKHKELHALLWRGGGVLLVANAVLAAVLLTFGRVVAVRFYHSPALRTAGQRDSRRKTDYFRAVALKNV